MKKTLIFAILLCTLLLDSCSYKKIIYLQDMDTLTTYEVVEPDDPRIRVKDRLRICVTCKEPALAAPFNLGAEVSDATVAQAATSLNVVQVAQGAVTPGSTYQVDKLGNINFPVLGEIKVAGMSLKGLEEEIAARIIAGNYIKEPVVFVEFENFQVTVLGEIGGKGNYMINTGSINMFELIAKCGDLTKNAQRDEIVVVRTEGGRRNMYTINMLSKECFDSPVYYLQQNDIVYVKPRKNQANEAKQTWFQITGWLLSLLSTASTIFYWISRARG